MSTLTQVYESMHQMWLLHEIENETGLKHLPYWKVVMITHAWSKGVIRSHPSAEMGG